MKILFSFLVLSALITFSQKTVATDICAPNFLSTKNAAEICKKTCIEAGQGGSWNGNWIGTTENKCKDPNTSGSVCGCNFTGCTDLILDYDHPDENAPNWTASVWYTPCGSNQEAGTAWSATNWSDNHLSVASGTRVRIGAAGTNDNFVNQVVTEPKFHVQCRGNIGPGHSADDPPCCEEANTPHPCTTVTVSYSPGVTWTATAIYTPCSKCGQRTAITSDALGKWTQDLNITSNTSVKIGPMWTNNNYIPDTTLSGSKATIICSGKWLADSTCCVEGQPNCPPKQTTETKNGKEKRSEKPPVEKKVKK